MLRTPIIKPIPIPTKIDSTKTPTRIQPSEKSALLPALEKNLQISQLSFSQISVPLFLLPLIFIYKFQTDYTYDPINQSEEN